MNSLVPDLVTTAIDPPVLLPRDTSNGVTSTEIWSTKSKLIGFLIEPKPFALRPNGSLKLTPSIEKSLYLLLAPITDISAFLDEPVLIDTLGSSFAKSATDLLIVGTPSMAVLSNKVPVPTLIDPALVAVVTTSSTSAVDTSLMLILVDSLSTKNSPSTDSLAYPGADALTV